VNSEWGIVNRKAVSEGYREQEVRRSSEENRDLEEKRCSSGDLGAEKNGVLE
jgi:hypothetical protein